MEEGRRTWLNSLERIDHMVIVIDLQVIGLRKAEGYPNPLR
jgi:hypothetical protein